MSVAFNTLKSAQRLSAAGSSQDQAETLAATSAEGITEKVAIKDDLELVRKDIKELGTKIDTSIDGLRKNMASNLGTIVLGGFTALKLIETFLAN